MTDGNELSLWEGRPLNETRYRARFAFDPNSLTLPGYQQLELFNALGSGFERQFVLQMRFASGEYQLRLAAYLDTGSYVETDWLPISDAPHNLELDYQAAALALPMGI